MTNPFPTVARRLADLSTLAAALLIVLPAAAAGPASDWPEYHRDHRGWRYSPLAQIDTSNVRKLKIAWIHQPGDITQGLQATPLAIDGVVYYIGPNNRVFALDGKTGKERWRYFAEIEESGAQSVFAGYSRGVSIGLGKVFIGSTDGRAIALDQATGKPLWSTQLTEPRKCHGCNFTSPPTLAGDVLILGPTGGDVAQAGKIYAVDANTGAKLWEFETIRRDPSSWPGDSARTGGGGAWMPGQYDPTLGLYFVGTSNAAPDFDGSKRRGDNLYTATVLAIEPRSGQLRWHHQEVPHDVWDYDSAYEALLIPRAGRQMMVHLNKGGHVTVLDSASGQVDHVWRFSDHVNWVSGVDPKSGALIGRNEPEVGKSKLFCPSALGARSWNHGAYSPRTGLWYTNAQEFCNRITVSPDHDVDKLGYSQPFFGISEIRFEPPPGAKASARLQAVDPFTGKRVWSIDQPLPGLGSVLATAGDLIFNGDPRGIVRAHHARNGKVLWEFNTGSGIRSGLMSYAAGGKQYIVVPSGFGSLFPGFAGGLYPEFKQLNGGAALIAFTLE